MSHTSVPLASIVDAKIFEMVKIWNTTHNCTNSILKQLETGKWQMHCSEFHQWLIHLNTNPGVYWPYSLVPDPQNFLNCELSTILSSLDEGRKKEERKEVINHAQLAWYKVLSFSAPKKHESFCVQPRQSLLLSVQGTTTAVTADLVALGRSEDFSWGSWQASTRIKKGAKDWDGQMGAMMRLASVAYASLFQCALKHIQIHHVRTL